MNSAGFEAGILSLAFDPGFATTRMYKGGDPGNDASRVFGITTLELG